MRFDGGGLCWLGSGTGLRLLLLPRGAGWVPAAAGPGHRGSGPLQWYAAPDDIDSWGDLPHLGYLRTLPSTYRPLPVIGPSDLPALLSDDPDVYATSVAEPGVRRLGPLTRVEHEQECQATRIGDALCYTADTGPCPALDELAKRDARCCSPRRREWRPTGRCRATSPPVTPAGWPPGQVPSCWF